MPKLKLTPTPTFTAAVAIPVPGGKAVPVVFTFRHRTREQFKEFADAIEGREDVDLIMDMASGWDLDDPFDAEKVAAMAANYIGAPRAIFDTYVRELTGAREKN